MWPQRLIPPHLVGMPQATTLLAGYPCSDQDYSGLGAPRFPVGILAARSHHSSCPIVQIRTTPYAAQRLIPIHWKTPRIPTRAEWVALVNQIKAAEEWMAQYKDRYEKFYSMWATWITYANPPGLSAQEPSTAAAPCLMELGWGECRTPKSQTGSETVELWQICHRLP